MRNTAQNQIQMPLEGGKIGTQEQRLLSYLQTGKRCNPMIALNEMAIYRYSAVIYNLRQSGHTIESDTVKTLNKFGEKCRYDEHWLVIDGEQ